MDDDTQNPQGERKMFKGNWTCSKCGAAITQLPFEPDPNRVDRLMCLDCYRTVRQSFRK
jgi:CxxC-x17-CxxC domain-containing protein